LAPRSATQSPPAGVTPTTGPAHSAGTWHSIRFHHAARPGIDSGPHPPIMAAMTIQETIELQTTGHRHRHDVTDAVDGIVVTLQGEA
jgi:hypothetical protein